MSKFIWSINLPPSNKQTNKHPPSESLSNIQSPVGMQSSILVSVTDSFWIVKHLSQVLFYLLVKLKISVRPRASISGRMKVDAAAAAAEKMVCLCRVRFFFWDGTRRTKIFKVVRSAEKFDSSISKKWIRKRFLCQNISTHFLVSPS